MHDLDGRIHACAPTAVREAEAEIDVVELDGQVFGIEAADGFEFAPFDR